MMQKLIILVLGIWAMTAVVAKAQDADAIENVIGSQLEAFNDRDVDAAWSFASPLIKRLFGSPNNFGMMVKRGYPMVWDNADVRFLELSIEDGAPMQTIMLRDPDGNLHFLAYKMIETANGWQIDGVQLLDPDLSA
jgi:hypothetical protein